VAPWRVALEVRKLGAVSFSVRFTAVHTLAVEAADHGLLVLRDGIEELLEALLTAVQQTRRIVFSI